MPSASRWRSGPGPVLLELPEDIAGEEVKDVPLVPPHDVPLPVANPAALERATQMLLAAKRPLLMAGAGANRPRLTDALSEFVRRTRLPFFNTQMGKGAVAGGSKLYMGTAALSERDYVHRAIDRADVDPVDRPRHGGEAAVPDGPEGAEGDPCRLHAGACRAGVLSARRADRRCRAEPGAARRPDRGQARHRSRLRRPAQRDPGQAAGPRRRGALPADAAAHRARRARR